VGEGYQCFVFFHDFLLSSVLVLDVADGPFRKPPGNAGDGQGQEPLGDGDPLDNDLGDDGSKDDGDGGPGDSSKHFAEHIYEL
jgi:hypothetical protein